MFVHGFFIFSLLISQRSYLAEMASPPTVEKLGPALFRILDRNVTLRAVGASSLVVTGARQRFCSPALPHHSQYFLSLSVDIPETDNALVDGEPFRSWLMSVQD